MALLFFLAFRNVTTDLSCRSSVDKCQRLIENDQRGSSRTTSQKVSYDSVRRHTKCLRRSKLDRGKVNVYVLQRL